MLSYVQAAILGLLQGFTELFPISSLGHTVLVPAVLRWNIDQGSDQFLSFVVLTHLATALVLLGFFWKDWVRIVVEFVRSIVHRKIATAYARLAWLIVVSTIPAGLIGILLQKKIQTLFGSPTIVAIALILNGALLYGAELLRRASAPSAASDRVIAKMTWSQSIGIGFAQCLALIPGFSRTGAAMTGGLVSGLNHANAARYSFLLATPLIFAAAVLKVPHVFHYREGLGPALIGALCAAISAYLSIRFLVRYFETKTLKPFALYCAAAGLIALALLLL